MTFKGTIVKRFIRVASKNRNETMSDIFSWDIFKNWAWDNNSTLDNNFYWSKSTKIF